MENNNLSYDQLLIKIKTEMDLINDPNISLELAMTKFEACQKMIVLAKAQLELQKGKVWKVLEDHNLEEFN